MSYNMTAAVDAATRIGADPAHAGGINAALAAGFDLTKIATLLMKWGPEGGAMLAEALVLFGAFSWPGLWAFCLKYGQDAALFFADLISLFGQPAPRADHVGPLPTV